MRTLQYIVLNFSDAQAFQSFVGMVRANGGGDGAEDVLGGLQAVTNQLNWRKDANKV